MPGGMFGPNPGVSAAQSHSASDRFLNGYAFASAGSCGETFSSWSRYRRQVGADNWRILQMHTSGRLIRLALPTLASLSFNRVLSRPFTGGMLAAWHFPSLPPTLQTHTAVEIMP